MSLLTSNLIAVKHDLAKADMMIAKSYVDEAIQRIEELETAVKTHKDTIHKKLERVVDKHCIEDKELRKVVEVADDHRS